MRKKPADNSRNQNPEKQPEPLISELEGLVNLGMQQEALRLVRRSLKKPAMTANTLNEALDTILVLAGKLTSWTQLVESAYARLPKKDRPAVRGVMIAFRHHSRDHEGVLHLLPKRLAGALSELELPCAIDAAFALGRTDLAEKLAKRLPSAIRDSDDPIIRPLMLLCQAEVSVRKGKLDDAIALSETVLPIPTLSRDAVERIIEVHVIRALQALRNGFQRIKQFNQAFLPAMELKLSGNERAVQDETASSFRSLQRILEKIVPQERQKELGRRPEP